jgi:hypothetical protein
VVALQFVSLAPSTLQALFSMLPGLVVVVGDSAVAVVLLGCDRVGFGWLCKEDQISYVISEWYN